MTSDSIFIESEDFDSELAVLFLAMLDFEKQMFSSMSPNIVRDFNMDGTTCQYNNTSNSTDCKF